MEILPLIGWVQMEILGSDWLVPNGNTGPKVNKMDILFSDCLIPTEILHSGWLIAKESRLYSYWPRKNL